MPIYNRMGMSEMAYAERCGVVRQSVAQWRKAGKLVLYEDGTINAEESDKRRAEMNVRSRPYRESANNSGSESPPPKPIGTAGSVRERHADAERGTNYAEARAANEVMKAQERRIRLQQMKGEIVERARAIAAVFRLSRQERDSWLGWPARVASVMAAELGIQPHLMQTVLDKHVREHLESLAEVRLEL